MFTLKTWNSVTKRPKKGENTCQVGVGGEAEKVGPGVQNGPPQPGPGQGWQGLCALKCAITSQHIAQCFFYIFSSFFLFFLLFFFLQNKWDPVEKLILFTLQSVETNFRTFSHNLQKVLGSDVSSMLIGQCLCRTNHSTGQNCSEISS